MNASFPTNQAHLQALIANTIVSPYLRIPSERRASLSGLNTLYTQSALQKAYVDFAVEATIDDFIEAGHIASCILHPDKAGTPEQARLLFTEGISSHLDFFISYAEVACDAYLSMDEEDLLYETYRIKGI